MLIIDVIGIAFMAFGTLFMITGTLGLLRFPDFYSRLHATGKCDTLGEALVILGFMIYGFSLSNMPFLTIKLIFLILFIFIANPVATHAIMKAAYNTGVKPWKKGDKRM